MKDLVKDDKLLDKLDKFEDHLKTMFSIRVESNKSYLERLNELLTTIEDQEKLKETESKIEFLRSERSYIDSVYEKRKIDFSKKDLGLNEFKKISDKDNATDIIKAIKKLEVIDKDNKELKSYLGAVLDSRYSKVKKAVDGLLKVYKNSKDQDEKEKISSVLDGYRFEKTLIQRYKGNDGNNRDINKDREK